MPEPREPQDFSESGQPIYRHQEETPFEFACGDEANIELIAGHIEQYLGPAETVLHELISDGVHIDVHVVLPNEKSPYIRLVTSGMSDQPMTTPPDADLPRYAELMITLPPDWKLTEADFKDEQWYWPIRQLKFLARLPHKYQTWLGFGHTVPNGDPAEPYAANTKLCGAVILPSVTVPGEFSELHYGPDKTIVFYSVYPLYVEEMNLKLKKGVDALIERFEKKEMIDVVDPRRPNVARKFLGLF